MTNELTLDVTLLEINGIINREVNFNFSTFLQLEFTFCGYFNKFIENFQGYTSVKILETQFYDEIENPLLLVKNLDSSQIWILKPFKNLNHKGEMFTFWDFQHNFLHSKLISSNKNVNSKLNINEEENIGKIGLESFKKNPNNFNYEEINNIGDSIEIDNYFEKILITLSSFDKYEEVLIIKFNIK